jgi:hypothetical protein
MTSGEYPGDSDPQRRLRMPQPSDVARTVALRTGNFAINPDVYATMGGRIDVALQIAENELDTSTAVVRLEHIGDEGSRQPKRSVAEVAIGHFLPETSTWAMYPEYIPADDNQLALLKIFIQNLSRDLDDVKLLRASEKIREPFVDLRHVSTTRLRKLTANLLHASGLHDKLIDHHNVFPDGTTVRHDGSTTSHVIIAPRFDTSIIDDHLKAANSVFHPKVPNLKLMQTMSVVYRGAIFSQDGLHSTRGEHVVHVATRDENYPGLWMPDQGFLTPADVQVFETIRGSMLAEKRVTDNFLADRCAVGFSMVDSFTNQN